MAEWNCLGEVRIQSQDTGARQKLYCDSAGSYSSSELPQGLYRIRVRSEGFLTKSHSDVTVFAGKTERVDFMIDVTSPAPGNDRIGRAEQYRSGG
jgi:hypothetical protein